MKWTKLIINVNPMAVEALANALVEIGIEGVEIDDNILTDADKEAMFVNYVDESIKPLDEHRVIAYLDESYDVAEIQQKAKEQLKAIEEFLPIGSGHIEIEVMPDEDYENKWKEFYTTFRVGDHIVISPIWEETEVTEEDILIKIDPGMAFGSGTHETTSMCIESLEAQDCRGKEVVDVGCGSGILGIVATKFGAKKVTGVDIDSAAVSIAKENVITNNAEDVMEVLHGDLLDKIDKKVDLVVANILADVIILIASDVKSILHDGGTFISSGIILDKLDDTVKALEGAGFSDIVATTKGEWAAITAR